MHDGMPYGRNQGQSQGHSREVDRQSPTGLILSFLLFQKHYIVLIFVVRWRHNFRKIAVKKLRKVEKLAEKFVRTTSYRQLKDLKKIPLQQFRAENVDVQLYKIFGMSLHSADSNCQNFVEVIQKRLGMNKFVRTKSHTGNKFSKTSLGLLCT